MYFITRATSINYIDGKGHKSELRSSRNDLTKSYDVLITPLVIYGLGGSNSHCYCGVTWWKQAIPPLYYDFLNYLKLQLIRESYRSWMAVRERGFMVPTYIIMLIAISYHADQLSHCQLSHSNQLQVMAIQLVTVSLILFVAEFNYRLP